MFKDDFMANKALLLTQIIIIVFMGTYYWYRYREIQNKRDLYQDKGIASMCPDTWIVKGENKCQNDKNIGRCNLGKNIKDFSAEYYKDPKAKCVWSKYCKAPWQHIDNLCSDYNAK